MYALHVHSEKIRKKLLLSDKGDSYLGLNDTHLGNFTLCTVYKSNWTNSQRLSKCTVQVNSNTPKQMHYTGRNQITN